MFDITISYLSSVLNCNIGRISFGTKLYYEQNMELNRIIIIQEAL
jgi:hypothetical protein